MRGIRIVAGKREKRVGDVVAEAIEKYIGNEVRAETALFFEDDAPRMEQHSDNKEPA
jgi:hypothetical protein